MGEAEKSYGIAQIVFHVVAAAFCLGNLIASVITISTLNDLLGDGDGRSIVSDESDKDGRYRVVAGWLIFVCVVALVFEVIMVVLRSLYFSQVVSAGFVVLGAVNAVFSVLFALGLLAGGAASTANAVDVQDFINKISSLCDHSPIYDELVCDKWEQLRNSMAAAAVLSFLGAGVFIGLTIVTIVGVTKKRQESLA